MIRAHPAAPLTLEQSVNMSASAYFSNQCHNDVPIKPATGQELAELIDEVLALGDSACNHLTVLVDNESGQIVTILSVGVQLDGSTGSIRFEGPEGTFFSKGPKTSSEPIPYYSYGNEEFFPGNSAIDLSTIKRALVDFYDRSFLRPDNIQWQDRPEEYSGWYRDDSDDELPDGVKQREPHPLADIDPWADSD